MGECDICEGDNTISYTCNECGGTFCATHRLPEAHRCETLLNKDAEEWFKGELSVRENRQSTRVVRDRDDDDNTATEQTENTDTSWNPHQDDGSETPETTCLECDRVTEQECDQCGTPYCKRHKSPRVHNCAFLDTDEDGVGNTSTPPKPEFRNTDDAENQGLLSSGLSWLRDYF